GVGGGDEHQPDRQCPPTLLKESRDWPSPGDRRPRQDGRLLHDQKSALSEQALLLRGFRGRGRVVHAGLQATDDPFWNQAEQLWIVRTFVARSGRRPSLVADANRCASRTDYCYVRAALYAAG